MQTTFEPVPPPIQFPRAIIPRYRPRPRPSILPLATCLWLLAVIVLGASYLGFFLTDQNYRVVGNLIFDGRQIFAAGMTREAWIIKGAIQAAAFGGCLASIPYAIFLAVWAGTKGK